MGRGMTFAWHEVPIGQAARPVERLEAPVAGRVYRQVGVRLWGEGAYEREPMDGGDTRYSSLNRVQAGDIIVNKIWARNGSVSVVTPELDGCYCSGEFPLFRPHEGRLDPEWFRWITKTKWFWQRCDEQSQGTSGKNRIRPERFLGILIPLPPLEEQRRIVAVIVRLAGKIEEARELQTEVADGWENLCRAILQAPDSKKTPMREIVEQRELDVKVVSHETYDFAGVYCFGGGVFKGQRKSGMEIGYSRLTRLRAGDFVYPKLMAWEGALGVVPPACEGLVVSPEFPVFHIRQGSVLPEVLDVYFRTPSVWPLLGAISTGTNVRRRRLHPDKFLAFEIPLPSKKEQDELRRVKTRVDLMKALQARTAAELDALLPAVLDRAFRGDL